MLDLDLAWICFLLDCGVAEIACVWSNQSQDSIRIYIIVVIDSSFGAVSQWATSVPKILFESGLSMVYFAVPL